MECFWPEDLLSISNKNTNREITKILAFQADTIRSVTGGLVEGLLRDRSTDSNISWSLELFPANQLETSTPLLFIRSESDPFPLTIETFEKESPFIIKAHDISEFKKALKKALSLPEIKRIVKYLASESNAAKHQDLFFKKRSNSTQRSFLIGKLTEISGVKYSHVVLCDVAGFINATDIEKITRTPDTPGSPIKRIGENYIVTTKFIDEVKFTLNNKELKTLQKEASKALTK